MADKDIDEVVAALYECSGRLFISGEPGSTDEAMEIRSSARRLGQAAIANRTPEVEQAVGELKAATATLKKRLSDLEAAAEAVEQAKAVATLVDRLLLIIASVA